MHSEYYRAGCVFRIMTMTTSMKTLISEELGIKNH